MPFFIRYNIVAALSLAVLITAAAAQSVPNPESVLGFRPGADFKLATYEESIEYFRRLDEASDRITLVRTGRTSEGRDWFIALISSAKNLRDVTHYREIADQLAHPTGLIEQEARRLSAEGKAIVDISGGLHATEVAGAQHTIALAYELVSSENSRISTIRENVITVLWPSLNPDGQTMVAEWYRSNVGTPYEVAPMPRLYQKYIGHDNNRDGYMLNMVESRVLARTWQEWDPQVIYVHHQSSPFPTRIWLPPFAEPIATHAPPLMSRTVNTLGMTIAQMLEARGMPGAVHMGTGFDAWYPGYVDYLPVLQNQAAFWTETALYRFATPRLYTMQDFPQARRSLRSESLYPSPWEGGWWRLGDAVEYMHVASIAVLDYAAKYGEDLLYNRYQSGRNIIEKYSRQPPYAYFIAKNQRDPVAPVELLRRLAFNGVRVYELETGVAHDGIEHAAGSWVIPMDQEFAELARQILEVQDYPDLREYPEGPPEQPYDAAGWTLGYQMGVHIIEATQPLEADVRSKFRRLEAKPLAWDADVEDASPFDAVRGVGFDSHPVAAAIRPLTGRIVGTGDALILDPAQNNSFRALNAAWSVGGQVGFDQGRYSVTGLTGQMADRLTAELALQSRRGPAARTTIPQPRVGLYRPWSPSMDEGWSRWLLESYGFVFTNLRNSDVHAGNLEDRYDVIVLPAERGSLLKEGYTKGSVPPRYEGGLGEAGLRTLEAFVRAGGTLVCMNQASDLCIDELHLPVENVVRGKDRDSFFSAGSILQVRVDTWHPIVAGMPDLGQVFFDRSPVFTVTNGFEGAALATYQDAGSPLMSGYLLGEEHLQGMAAALDVRHGDGHVILLGFRPQWRGQPHGTFKVLFNSLLFHGSVARKASGTEGFWTPPEREPPPDQRVKGR